MSSLPFLDTVSGEIAFFRCLIYHRPVGKDRLSTMLKIHSEIKESHPLEYLDESEADLWRKYGELYDFEGAEEVSEEDSPVGSAEGVSTNNPESSSKGHLHHPGSSGASPSSSQDHDPLDLLRGSSHARGQASLEKKRVTRAAVGGPGGGGDVSSSPAKKRKTTRSKADTMEEAGTGTEGSSGSELTEMDDDDSSNENEQEDRDEVQEEGTDGDGDEKPVLNQELALPLPTTVKRGGRTRSRSISVATSGAESKPLTAVQEAKVADAKRKRQERDAAKKVAAAGKKKR